MTMKELFAPSDMTVGKPWEKIVAFTIPMLIGNIAQQLYNTVDSIVIGKYVGDNALAAVGSASPILNLLLVLFVGISRRRRRHGVAVFWSKTKKRAFDDDRKLRHADSNFLHHYYDSGSRPLKAAAGNAENTGFYHRLVYLYLVILMVAVPACVL